MGFINFVGLRGNVSQKIECKCWKSAFTRGEEKDEFLGSVSQNFLSSERICVSVSEVCWEESWVTCLLWNTSMCQFEAFRQSQHAAWYNQTASYVVKQVSVCRTSLPARKGEVWWVSSPSQIWVHWLSAKVCAAPRGLYCSPLSTETGTPSVSLQNTARISPVEVRWTFEWTIQLNQKIICSKVHHKVGVLRYMLRNKVCHYIKYHSNFKFLWIFLNWRKPTECVISQRRDAPKIALRSISNSHLFSSNYSKINRIQPGS